MVRPNSGGRRLCLASLIAVLFGLWAAPGAWAGEAYYVLMFGEQRIPNNPDYSHTFATFVKATWVGDGPCPQSPVLECHTISWLPANMKVRAFATFAECGHNFEMH